MNLAVPKNCLCLACVLENYYFIPFLAYAEGEAAA